MKFVCAGMKLDLRDHVILKSFSLFLCLLLGAGVSLAEEYWVTTAADHGPGSFRSALTHALKAQENANIRFASDSKVFSKPQIIAIGEPLPKINRTISIDGYIEGLLWKPSGITLKGSNGGRIFDVSSEGALHLRHISLSDGGSVDFGGAILNQGTTVLESVTVKHSSAKKGGAIASLKGRLHISNSTFFSNSAQEEGGAVFVNQGSVTVVNTTFAENRAPHGTGLFVKGGTLNLFNSILANGSGSFDCYLDASSSAISSHNIIEQDMNCGGSLSAEDPRLGKVGLYNGPTPTIPLGTKSPAINMGDNTLARNFTGESLRYDQRGNGDTRYAAGITDIGAFEQQAVTLLSVDTLEDEDYRWCTRASNDCSLRGALAIANASSRHNQITFDPKLFAAEGKGVLEMSKPLPVVTKDILFAAPPGSSLSIQLAEPTLRRSEAVRVEQKGVKFLPGSSF